MSVYPEAGSIIPPEMNGGQAGCVVGECGHRMAGSEWAAGFRTCERCPSSEWDDDDPPDYDHEAADRAEEHAAAQAELAAIEAEEAHDRAGEAWYEATYGQGGTS